MQWYMQRGCLESTFFHITQSKLIWMNPSSGGCRGSSVFQELGAGQILCTTGSKSAMMLSSRGCREQSTTGWMRMRWATFGRLLYKIRAEQLWCLITDQAMVEWVEQFWYNEQATNFGAWPVLRGAMVGRAKRLYRTQQCWLLTYMIRGYAWSAFSRAIVGWAKQNSKHDEQRLCRAVQRLIHRMSRLCTVQEQSVLEQMSRVCLSRRCANCTEKGEQTVHEQTPIFVPSRRLNNHSHDLASKWLWYDNWRMNDILAETWGDPTSFP